MKKAMWLSLWAISLCGAVVGAAVVARPKQPKWTAPMPRPETKHPEKPDASDLVTELDSLREGMAERDNEIRWLGKELAALKSRLRADLSPELEKELRERLESHKRDEAGRLERERGHALWPKILQRKDKALREAGLTELLALLQSANPKDREMGLDVLRGLGSIPFNMEKYRPYVLAALSDERASIRRQALDCLGRVCSEDERLEIAARMIQDPDDRLRYWAALELNASGKAGHREIAIPTLRSFLEESDRERKWEILEQLDDSADAMDDVVVKLMGEEGLRGAFHSFMRDRKTITPPIVQRVAEMYEKGEREDTIFWFMDTVELRSPDDPERQSGRPCLSDDARPMAADLYVKIVKDAPGNGARRHALGALRNLGEARVIAELDQISRSPDSEGIEDELTKTIEHLRNLPGQRR